MLRQEIFDGCVELMGEGSKIKTCDLTQHHFIQRASEEKIVTIINRAIHDDRGDVIVVYSIRQRLSKIQE
jgi:hypothetical protein